MKRGMHGHGPSSVEQNKSSGGMCCIRVSLIIFNLITTLAGIATLGIGIWLFQQSRTEPEDASQLLAEILEKSNIPNHGEFRGFSILLIGLGALVTFVSFIGCFGACIKSRCLLLSYLASVVLILSLQLLVSIFAIVYRQPVTNSIRDELMVTVKTLYRPNNPTGATWDMVHRQFQCCGIDTYSDWFDTAAWPKEEFVPDSCCLYTNATTECGKSMDPSIWQRQGCLAQIQIWILEQLHILASAVITLVFLQLYGIIASTLLFYHTKTPKPKTQKAFKSYPYERAHM